MALVIYFLFISFYFCSFLFFYHLDFFGVKREEGAKGELVGGGRVSLEVGISTRCLFTQVS